MKPNELALKDLELQEKKCRNTRMHSSRMRTVRCCAHFGIGGLAA